MKQNTLVAGPWAGEFGWELFEWQSFVRAKAKNFDKVVVSSKPGHRILYDDFCDEYIPFKANAKNCCGWTNFVNRTTPNVFKGIACDDMMIPNKYQKGPQEFIKYGNASDDLKYDIVVHARHFPDYKDDRNWKINKWDDLIPTLLAKGLKICSIGVKGVSYYIGGTENKMDIPLKDLADVLASSKMTIGQSSGPMHFASLCGCPHLVWTADSNIERYETKWNPLKTPVHLYWEESWNPSVDNILKQIDKSGFLDG